jgi:hypothetical protein
MEEFSIPRTGAKLAAMLPTLTDEQFDEVLKYSMTLPHDADLRQALRRFGEMAQRMHEEHAAQVAGVRAQCQAAFAGALAALRVMDGSRALHAARVSEVQAADDAARSLLRSINELGQLQAPDYMAALQAWGDGRASTLARDREAHIASLTRSWSPPVVFAAGS